MKLWSARFDENQKDNFPQVVFKNTVITIEQETKLTKELFRIFYLTHRDARQKIELIENNVKKELPYRKLYNLIYPPKELEFETEYFVELLNLFQVELNRI